MTEQFFTGTRKDGQEPLNTEGSTKEEIGYTTNKVISKDENGHYEFSEPEKIDVGSEYCFAKKVKINFSDKSAKEKYYLKVGIDGFIFNPFGLFSEGTEKKYANRHGKSSWSFKEVNNKCFDFYVKFLQSKNQAWLTNAEREYR